MKLLQVQAAIGTAIVVLSSPADAKHAPLSHLEALKRHSHKKVHPSPRVEGIEDGLHDGLKKRGGSCTFPSGAGLVSVTPGSKNAGWAMSPDQECTPDSYCPYACPSGQVMAQWSPAATSYTYPGSMAGGLFCDANGAISKPFPSKPYCVDGTGSINAKNTAGKVVSFCQTVLPGNEAMIIPTSVTGTATLAVPGTSYWCSTAAHYYINAPGISTSDACIWGDGTKALGNWSPYVAGANTDANGNTFVKIGWNPIFIGCDLSKTTPSFGVKIECNGSGCNGTPCSIDPSVVGVGGVTSADQATGAGGANFCVVTVPSGQTANIVVFNTGSSGSDSSASDSKAKAADEPSTSKAPTPTPTPTSVAPTSAPPTSTKAPTTSSTPPPSSSTPISTSHSAVVSSSAVSSLTKLASSSGSSASATATPDNSPHVFFENTNSTTTSAATKPGATGTGGIVLSATIASTNTAPVPTTSKKSSAPETTVSGSMFSFLVLFAFASYML